jgi:hypothetical protein
MWKEGHFLFFLFLLSLFRLLREQQENAGKKAITYPARLTPTLHSRRVFPGNDDGEHVHWRCTGYCSQLGQREGNNIEWLHCGIP